MRLGRTSIDLCKELFLAIVSDSLDLTLEIGCMQSDFLVPVASFDDKCLCSLSESFHLLMDQSIEKRGKLVCNLVKRLLLELLHFSHELIIRLLPQKLQLRVKAVIQLRQDVI